MEIVGPSISSVYLHTCYVPMVGSLAVCPVTSRL